MVPTLHEVVRSGIGYVGQILMQFRLHASLKCVGYLNKNSYCMSIGIKVGAKGTRAQVEGVSR